MVPSRCLQIILEHSKFAFMNNLESYSKVSLEYFDFESLKTVNQMNISIERPHHVNFHQFSRKF